jgi:hypothetical protein
MVLEKGFIEPLPGNVKHNFNEFEFAILNVSLIQNVSFLHDVLIDNQYTISSPLNQLIHNTIDEEMVLEKRLDRTSSMKCETPI